MTAPQVRIYATGSASAPSHLFRLATRDGDLVVGSWPGLTAPTMAYQWIYSKQEMVALDVNNFVLRLK